MATVTHYTSFDAALQILLSGKIRFGNIRYCNDKIEIDKDKNIEIFYRFMI